MLQTLPLTSPVFADASITFSWYWLSWYSCMPAIRDSVYRAKLSNIKIPRMFIPWSYDIFTEFRPLSGSGVVSSNTTPIGLTSIGARSRRAISSGCLPEFFGIPQGFVGTGKNFFSASELPEASFERVGVLQTPGQMTCSIPYFMYYSIFYHHRANLQDSTFPVLLRSSSDNYEKTGVVLRSISSLQEYLSSAAGYSSSDDTALDGYHALALLGSSPTSGKDGHGVPLFPDLDGRALIGRNCGLWCSPARADYFTSYVSAINYNAITSAGSVTISEGLFTVDSLILAQALRRFNAYESYNNGTFLDMLYSLYEAKPQANGMVPVFLGRDNAPFDFQSIFATSSEGLGDLGGRGSANNNFRSRRFRFDNYGTLMCIAEIRPHLSYFQGRSDGELQYLTDVPSSVLDTNDLVPTPYSELYGIGGSLYSADGKACNLSIPAYFQPRGSIAKNNNPDVNVYGAIAGYRPRFSSWKTDFDRVHGDLCGSLANWTFAKSFGFNPQDPQQPASFSVGLTNAYNTFGNGVYCLPWQMNRVFTDTSDSSQNFILSVDFQITAKLPLYRPNFAEL